MDKKIEEIKELYKHELDVYDNWEIQDAPSGEWAEYNYDYIEQRAIVDTLAHVLNILEVDLDGFESTED